MKDAPTPRTNLPNNAVKKESATEVMKLPTTVKAADVNPIDLSPYLSTNLPAGKARRIPGITTIDIKNPANHSSEGPKLNASVIGATSGGTS